MESTAKDNAAWERAWSLDELRNETLTWTLANDAGLMRYLQDFSGRILSKTKDIESQVDSLVFDTKSTDIKVHNAFNEFLMLSNSQFIENRVYEDDETSTVTKEEEKKKDDKSSMTHEQLEAILIPKYTEALTLGTEVLLSMNADNEDDEEHNDDETQESPENKEKKTQN